MDAPRRHRFAAIAACLLIACAGAPMATAAAASAGKPQTITDLGTLTFPTSTKSATAQTAFIRGALLLHLFEYEDAAKAFQQAETLDPDFAMAYWGEAMTHNHGVWNQVDEKAGRAALEKFGATATDRAAKVPTAREKAYLAAVEILYDGQGSKAQRDARYEQSMAKLAKDYPDDHQAQLFYSLALLGRSEGVRDMPTYLQAAAISKRIFRTSPQNPGAAHYWIHGMDDPAHAAGALEAARALSQIAPGAGHAQHMTSHIFMALGMWDDVERANLNAMRVVDAQRDAQGKPRVACFHYEEWLEYTYFEQGRNADGLKLLQDCHDSGSAALQGMKGKEAEAFARRLGWSLTMMRATAVIESRDWNGMAASLPVEIPQGSAAQAWNHFAIGYAAAERGEMDKAQHALDSLDQLVATAQPDPEDLQQVDYLHILSGELGGLIASKRGDHARAIALASEAAKRYDGLAFDFGPPVTVKPPHELLGELLLAAGNAQQARAEFAAALKQAPNRTQSLLGLARAQVAVHDTAAAAATYRQLVAIWHAADPGLPGLIEARRYRAASSGG
jgi:tetratricopeptide (TPR) repeat protein